MMNDPPDEIQSLSLIHENLASLIIGITDQYFANIYQHGTSSLVPVLCLQDYLRTYFSTRLNLLQCQICLSISIRITKYHDDDDE